MNTEISFEQLPNAVFQISKRLDNIERLLLNQQSNNTSLALEELKNVHEAANFLSLSVPTIYAKVSKGELPYMKRGKRLYFTREELLEYLKKGHHKTKDQLEAEATNYLTSKKR